MVEVLFSKMLKTMDVETSTWSTPTITVKRTLKDCLFICIINGRKAGMGDLWPGGHIRPSKPFGLALPPH